jgi:hypothetical protein
MPISMTCECGRQLLAKDEYAGRRTRCPDCGRELLIPAAGGMAPPPPGGGGLEFEPGPPKFGPSFGEPAEKTSGKAITSLVLGICSLFCCLTGIPAIVFGILGLNEAKASQGRIKGEGLAIAGIVVGSFGTLISGVGVLIALLLPAVQQAREAARRVQCTNNLKQLGLALHNFHDANGAFPAQAITDPNGKPLLSWRVAILPYLEQGALYEQFHLDEPWDSPHNLSLLSQMPTVYQCPTEPPQVGSGMTTYQVIAGPGSLFDPQVAKFVQTGQTQGVRLTDVTDGTSNTLMVIESSNPVEWTKPDDIPYQPGGPTIPPGSKHPGGENALLGDGSVRFLRNSIAPQTLDALITRKGGEVISLDSF